MIIFCHLYNDRSGSPGVLNNIIDAIDVYNTDKLLLLGEGGDGILDQASIPTRRFWFKRSNSALLNLINFVRSQISLYRSLQDLSPPSDTVVYVNTLLPIAGAVWGRLNNCKVIVHGHEVSLRPAIFQRMLVALAIYCSDCFVCVSRYQAKALRLRNTTHRVLYNTVSEYIRIASHEFDYTPRRNGVFNILMIASLRDYKGIPEFLRLSDRLQQYHDITMTLVLNADPCEIESYFSTRRIASNITIFGKTRNVGKFIKSADVVLNLSRPSEWIETFGLTLLEAMTLGVPVIAPDVGGPTELIRQGKEGFLMNSANTDELVRRLISIKDNPGRALAMSAAAKKRAEFFSATKFRTNLYNILEQFGGLR